MSNRTVSAAIELTLELISRATEISQTVAQAQAENRTDLTDAEWASVTAASDAARDRLVAAIGAAGG